MFCVNASMADCHRQLEQTQAMLDAVSCLLAASPDDSELIAACREARQRHLDASLALMQAIDPPVPAIEIKPFRFTSGAVARQFRSGSSATVKAGHLHREVLSRRQQQRRSRAYA